MHDPAPPGTLAVQRAVLIVALLAGSVVVALFVAIYLRSTGALVSADSGLRLQLLSAAALALAAGQVMGFLLLRRQLRRRLAAERELALALLRRDLAHPLLFQEALFGAAMGEGASLFALVILVLGGPWWLLAVPGAGLLATLTLLPTRGRLEEIAQGVRADVP